MATLLQIKYVQGETVAFTINTELYYLKWGPDFPRVYDRSLKCLIIPNMDYWFQAQTQQRYSYRGVLDMAKAFQEGLTHSYASNDLRGICGRIFDISCYYLFQTAYARTYARTYKVELLEPRAVGQLTQPLNEQFEQYRTNLGDEKFYDYLCRLWQFCNFHKPGDASIFERLISRLGRKPREPVYPMPELHAEVRQHVINRAIKTDITAFKGIAEEIVERVHGIQAGRL